MTRKVEMSNQKFIAYMIIFMFIGMLVTGLPLLTNAKGYYDERDAAQREVEAVKNDLDIKNTRTEYLQTEFNRVTKNYNRVLKAIELHDGRLPDGYTYETCDFGTLDSGYACM